MHYAWEFATLKPYTGLIWHGLLVTLAYTVTTVLTGLLLGLVTGVLRTTAPRWLTVPLRAYIELFRCTPLLVQLVWVYYAASSADRRRPFRHHRLLYHAVASTPALSTLKEIFPRRHRKPQDSGQWDAGRAIGMGRGKIFRRIVLPQATRVMIPSFINQTVLQLKNTSLVSTVAVGDLLYQGSVITAASYRPLEVYTTVAVLYFAVLFPLTLVADRVERYLAARR